MAEKIQCYSQAVISGKPISIIRANNATLATKIGEHLRNQTRIFPPNHLKAMTTEERMARYKLRPDRADVITHAADIFLEVATQSGATVILVPTIGLSDGIIDHLYSQHQPKNSAESH